MVPYMLPGVPIVASVRKVSLREEAYNLLQTLQKQYGATSLSDTVLLLAEKAKTCKTLMEELQAIEKRLEELETLQKKTYLALLRLLEEFTGSEEEGPESPAGAVEDEHPARTEPRPRGAVASTSSTDTQPRRGFRAPLPCCL